MYHLAYLYENHIKENYEGAEKYYKKILENNDKQYKVMFNLGNLYQNHLKKYQESEYYLLQAIENK